MDRVKPEPPPSEDGPTTIFYWTDIRKALPPKPCWCLVRRQLGLSGYGTSIQTAWWDGKDFWSEAPHIGRKLVMIDFTEEFWGDSAGVIGWSFYTEHWRD